MTSLVTHITTFISLGVVVSNIGVLISVVYFIVTLFDKPAREHFPQTRFAAWLRDHIPFMLFGMALVAMVGSLYYSEIAGFIACELCWYQRILFYPQVILLAILIWYKKLSAVWVQRLFGVVLTLSIIGAGLAAYHYYGQVMNPSILPCGLTPAESECALMPFKAFGYITIPMMALSGFLLQIVAIVWYIRARYVEYR